MHLVGGGNHKCTTVELPCKGYSQQVVVSSAQIHFWGGQHLNKECHELKEKSGIRFPFQSPDNHVTLDQGGKVFQRLLVQKWFSLDILQLNLQSCCRSVELVLQ